MPNAKLLADPRVTFSQVLSTLENAIATTASRVPVPQRLMAMLGATWLALATQLRCAVGPTDSLSTSSTLELNPQDLSVLHL